MHDILNPPHPDRLFNSHCAAMAIACPRAAFRRLLARRPDLIRHRIGRRLRFTWQDILDLRAALETSPDIVGDRPLFVMRDPALYQAYRNGRRSAMLRRMRQTSIIDPICFADI